MGTSRVRARYEKSTLGCRTCKIRRVKCDETQPCCLKCTSTGRRCDGPARKTLNFVPEPISKLVHKTPQTLSARPLQSHRPSDETRSFSFFIDNVAPVLAGKLDVGLWSSLLPQIAQTNDVVWDCLIAIGNLWANTLAIRRSERRNNHVAVLTARQRQALKWYGRALSSERSQTGGGGGVADVEKVLVIVLFLFFELQNHNYHSGFHMVRMAYSLLPHFMATPSSTWTSVLEHTLVTMFMRNACLISTSNHGTMMDIDRPSDMNELKTSLFHILLSVYGLLKEACFARDQDERLSKHVQSRRRALQLQLSNWHDTAQRLKPLQDNEAQRQQTTWLLEYHHITTTWLSAIPTSYLPIPTHFFHTLLHQSRTLINKYYHVQGSSSSDTRASLPRHFFEFAIVPPLYLTVMLSEDLDTETQASSLMNLATSPTAGTDMHCLVAMPEPGCEGVRMRQAHITWSGQGKKTRLNDYAVVRC